MSNSGAMRNAMDAQKTTLERAFDLARSGDFSRVGPLIAQLNREGYDGRQIEGPPLKKDLLGLIKEARTAVSIKQGSS